MSSNSILIIGASRGIGLGLTREFADRGWSVFASQRSASSELEKLAGSSDGNVQVVSADVTDGASITALRDAIGQDSLQALVVNAGVYGPSDQSITAMGRDDVADIMMTNSVGPAQAAVTLLPLLRKGGVIGMMTSKMGSIDDSSGGANHYRVSKVAQNMLARSVFENHAKERDIAVLSLHPGWVQTDMGGPNATITVDQSVKGLADLIEGQKTPEHRFLAYDGAEVPW